MPATVERIIKKLLNRSKASIRVAAVVTRGGAVISYACNVPYKSNCPEARGLRCAEARAIKPHADLEGTTLWVFRDNGRCSRPCKHCQLKIKAAGIDRVIYADYNKNLVKERF